MLQLSCSFGVLTYGFNLNPLRKLLVRLTSETSIDLGTSVPLEYCSALLCSATTCYGLCLWGGSVLVAISGVG